eukprot:CAMPEP_0118929990 /NCGR_PEP_ID=MMETSP1169-20130426/6830_1 /TAXON_ID=36882 /ORGANISM="Pyramimonas obovata, Strain CCMP722" /LENGTH=364 /DNA_ID=CAMNT_0006872279 /DNA_START=311 /DNA_END=1402 /DNA_ORIENTATION=-
MAMPTDECESETMAIHWSRGSKRHGNTTPVYPDTDAGGHCKFNFDQVIQLSATLYQAPGAVADRTPKYNKKTLVLSVVECSEKGPKANIVTGTVVIDISEYAGYECSSDQTFKVETNRAIKGAVGEPNLITTITCRWKGQGSGKTGPRSDGGNSIESSMSTDTTTSTTFAIKRDAEAVGRMQFMPKGLAAAAAGSPKPSPSNSKHGPAALAQQQETARKLTFGGEEYDEDGFLVDADDAPPPSALQAPHLPKPRGPPSPLKQREPAPSLMERLAARRKDRQQTQGLGSAGPGAGPLGGRQFGHSKSDANALSAPPEAVAVRDPLAATWSAGDLAAANPFGDPDASNPFADPPPSKPVSRHLERG